LHLGLDPVHIVLLALTCIVTVLTVVTGRATLLQAGVHLALLSAYLFLSFSP
jgi:Ca2+:H+ antiporter